jgi:hypothetical protein
MLTILKIQNEGQIKDGYEKKSMLNNNAILVFEKKKSAKE